MKISNLKTFLTRKSKGELLTGTVWYFIIFLGLIGAGVATYYLANKNSEIAETQSNIVILRSQVNQMFSGSSSYDELTNEVAVNAGAVPSQFLKGDTIVNEWGGNITLASDDNGSTFTIELDNIPQDACTQLGVFQPDSWLSLTINNTEIEGGSVVALTNACANDTNTITFKAR